MKKLFKPLQKNEAIPFVLKFIKVLKYIFLTIATLLFIYFSINGITMIQSEVDPAFAILNIIIAIISYITSIILITFIEALILGFVIIVENNNNK